MRIEATLRENRLLGVVSGRAFWEYSVDYYTATHGRVSATAPTMYEAIALCTNGVYQAKFIKSND